MVTTGCTGTVDCGVAGALADAARAAAPLLEAFVTPGVVTGCADSSFGGVALVLAAG